MVCEKRKVVGISEGALLLIPEKVSWAWELEGDAKTLPQGNSAFFEFSLRPHFEGSLVPFPFHC